MWLIVEKIFKKLRRMGRGRRDSELGQPIQKELPVKRSTGRKDYLNVIRSPCAEESKAKIVA